MSPVARYFVSLSVFLLFAGAALWYWNYSQIPAHTHPLSWYMLGFFAVVSVLVHLFLLASEQKAAGVFVRRFMLSTTLRLFAYLLIIVMYSFTHRATATVFILHFLVMYLLFTIFEVATLYRHFARKKQS